ncbi:MAG: cyclic-di-AMP receptor [Chloroflexota bacterium]
MSKLLVAIVHEADADRVIRALGADGHRVTQLRSSGGYLRMDNSTLVLGLEDDEVAAVLAILTRECSSREIELPPVLLGRLEDLPARVRHGGATVFLSDLEAILRI